MDRGAVKVKYSNDTQAGKEKDFKKSGIDCWFQEAARNCKKLYLMSV